jgi:dihydropteroate synthase
MGIINVSPDSFHTKGQASDLDALQGIVEKMLNDGAAVLDIGGASTKPGQDLVDADEELHRVMPAIEAIFKRFPDEAVDAGVAIVNDVSSGRFDDHMLLTVARLGVPYVAMHMQGTPKTMQADPQYGNVVQDVYDYLLDVCRQCDGEGIAQVIVDPGFGFGKTVDHNFTLLAGMRKLRSLGKPVLAGLSRKSMICRTLKVNPSAALNGTTALNMVALQQGANILRVHDVKEAVQVVKLWQALTF